MTQQPKATPPQQSPMQSSISHALTGLVVLLAFMLGMWWQRGGQIVPPAATNESIITETPARATNTLIPSTPLPTLTPSRTLQPPPTLEAATPTAPPSATPSITPTFNIVSNPTLPGVIFGLSTPTLTTTPGCKPRTDWKLIYRVQPNDALARIAEQFNTTAEAIAEGNCLRDLNIIVVGQELRVPGDPNAGPTAIPCVAWEALSPFDGAYGLEGTGPIAFTWRGPRAPRNLLRITRTDGTVVLERTFDLRQNETIQAQDIPTGGTYQWYIIPLDMNFRQISCAQGGPWTFHKNQSPPTNTPFP
jgi:LysM repeat protein